MKLTFTLISILFLTTLNSLCQTTIRQIKPSDTDPQIKSFDADSNYIYLNASVEKKNILVVHLPGSFGEPKRATLFGALSAELGFHSIGLMYPNVPTVGSFCSNSVDPDCFEKVRREIVEGNDYSSSINVTSSESILNRTKKLLVYLNNNFPDENWGQYLDNTNNLVFNKIIFSGHSQGGGHAALIGKYYSVKKVICFSSPKDWSNSTNEPASWLSSEHWLTPKSAIYCFNHVLDEHTNHQLQIWESLGLNNFGTAINVDSIPTPYANTRQLTTSHVVPVGDDHACTIQDNKTPKISTVPIFTPVWTYMLLDNLATDLSEDPPLQPYKLILNPNPTFNSVNITVQNGDYQVSVYDHTGKKLLEAQTVENSAKIDLSHLKSGIYFIIARSNKGVFVERLIKQ